MSNAANKMAEKPMSHAGEEHQSLSTIYARKKPARAMAARLREPTRFMSAAPVPEGGAAVVPLAPAAELTPTVAVEAMVEGATVVARVELP